MTFVALAWLVPTVLALAFLLLVTFKKPLLNTRWGAELSAGLLIVSFPFIFVLPAQAFILAYLAILQLCGLLLAARLIFGRLDKAFVFPSTQQNVSLLAILVAVGMAAWLTDANYPYVFKDTARLLLVCTLAALAAQIVFFAQFLWARGHFKLKRSLNPRPPKALPTVSVCIPARNEDHVLSECLQNVLASDYPKLEVLVLDDCSQDKTSQIIKSFAHDGVRFIQGEAPASGWLGKNQARQTLSEHASGNFLFFIDVDTRLEPHAITQLINYILDNRMAMVSVLPQNRLGFQPGALFDTLRFYWQQVLPITAHRIPVASQSWAIDAAALRSLGGFKSVAKKITPEASFARRLANTDSYRFITGHDELGFTTAKRWPSVVASAIRLLYPTYKRQPLFALAAAFVMLALFVLPPLLLSVLVLAGQFTLLFWLALAEWALTLLTYALVRVKSHPHVWLVGTVLLPVTALQEVWLLLGSLLQYEFGEVNWKGRNICYPVVTLQPQNQPGRLRSPFGR